MSAKRKRLSAILGPARHCKAMTRTGIVIAAVLVAAIAWAARHAVDERDRLDLGAGRSADAPGRAAADVAGG
jgi:hypothetical protein